MARAAKTGKDAMAARAGSRGVRDELGAQTAPVNTAASGVTQLVAAVAGKRVRVFGFMLVSSGAVSYQFQSGVNNLMGLAPMINGQQQAMGPAYDGVFDCNVGEALNINLSAAVQTSGFVIYAVIGG